MSYLPIGGRDVYQETGGSVGYEGVGARAKCIAPDFVLHCVMKARMTEGYGNLQLLFKIESSPRGSIG